MTNPLMFYASIAAVIAGFASGWVVRDWKADADTLKMYEKTDLLREKMQAKVESIATDYERWRADLEPGKVETRNTIREIYRNVEVPAECAAPAAVVSLLGAATDKANAAASGQPSPAVPAASAPAKSADRP